MRNALIVAAVLGLAGCAEMERLNAEAEARQREADRATCQSYGFSDGTDAFANCMMKTAQKRQEQQLAAQRQAEQDRKDAERRDRDAQAAADRDAETQRNIRMGEDVENQAAKDAGVGMPAQSDMHCETTTESTQSGNAGSSTSKTVCHN